MYSAFGEARAVGDSGRRFFGGVALTAWVLLSGFAGALLVFFLGVVREWWANERERRGLLRLLLAEIKHNEIVIETIQDSGTPLPTSPFLDALKTETWNESRETVAGLPPELREDLANYYEPLEIFRTLKSLPRAEGDPPIRGPQDVVKSVERSLKRLTEPLNRVLGLPTDRWESYARITVHAQNRAKERIEDYLDHRFLLAPLSLRVQRWAQRWQRRRPSQGHREDS